ncbi:uncharacterized protein LOC115956982 [Quercus lobata]|uniref:uncharacterized protein LOC115956982 n=1 Tax=Quercus lobata TaxID=97700 RepID=UPI0012478A73|nr:uncharacterized protein LOC115956982 [Quercus lobata]
MGIQQKQRSTLQELLEFQPGWNALEKAAYTKLPPPPPTQTLRADLADHKRKREEWAIQATFRAKETVNYSHRKMKEEEGRRIAAMDAFHVAEKINQELKRKLLEEERERKSAVAALDNIERQAEGQRVLLCNVKDQLVASKKHIIALKKKLEEVEKAKDQAKKAREEAKKAREEAEQQGYDIGVADTKEALRAEVLGVYRTYCLQVDTPLEVADLEKRSPNEVPPSSSSLPKVAEQPGVNGKGAEVTKGLAPNATKPSVAPQDPTRDKEAPKMEIILATLPIPAKGDPKGTD